MFFNIPIVFHEMFARIMLYSSSREMQLIINEYIHDPCHPYCPGRKMEVAGNQPIAFYGLAPGHLFGLLMGR